MKRLILFSFILFFSCEEDIYSEFKDTLAHQKELNKNIQGVACINDWHKYDFQKPQFTLEKGKLFGINGHPMHVNSTNHDCSYLRYTNLEQIGILNELGAGVYRTYIHVNEGGFWNGEDPQNFQELLNLCNSNGIELMPIFDASPWRIGEFHEGNNWNYDGVVNAITNSSPNGANYIRSLDIWGHYFEKGNETGENFSSNYRNQIRYYNISNEIAYILTKYFTHLNNPLCDGIPPEDCNLTPQQNEDFFINVYQGDEMEDFFTCEEYARRMVASAAYISGLIEGVKSGDNAKSTKCIVTDGKTNFGYFEFLNFMGVRYDAIGWNWYSGEFNGNYNGFNVYNSLLAVGGNKPIWITETNREAGSRSSSSNGNSVIDQSNAIRQNIESFYSLDKIEAILVYELLDQEGNVPGESNQWQDYYGIISSPITNPKYTIKPAYNTYRFTIEEFTYGYHNLMYSYYKLYAGDERNLIGDTGIEYWSGQLKNGSNFGNILNNILDDDSGYFINQSFINYLDRPASPSDISQYRGKMADEGKTREWFIGTLCGSSDFYTKAQNYNYNQSTQVRNFIYHAYNKLLAKTPTSQQVIQASLNYPNLATDGSARTTFVMNVILNSTDFKTNFILEQYQIYMERDLFQDSNYETVVNHHINTWINQKALIINLMKSDEFWRKSVIRGYCKRHNL